MPPSLPVVAAGPSIYGFIQSHLDPAGRLDPEGVTLPDEAKVMSGGVRWAPGAMDGAFGHHAGGGQSTHRVGELAKLATRACERPSKRRLRKFYKAVSDDAVLDIIDPLLEQLVERQPDRPALSELGRWLATRAPDRGAVKVGLALLGLAGVHQSLKVVRTLGAHDEFTLYAAAALTNGLPDPDSELWALASAVEGWGRIQCVERLRETTDPRIRSWILREGFRNSIMYEYLAYIAAETGGLLAALRADVVDRELLTAVGEILEALVAGGPAEDMDSYDAGADATEAYLGIVRTRAERLGDFQAVAALHRWLDSEGDWDGRHARGWTDARREVLRAACQEILDRDIWGDRVAVGLLSDDPAEFWRAEQVARARGIDTFEIHLAKIEANPLDGNWYQAWEQADHGRAEQLTELARTRLPLEKIPTGPADEVGFGPAWRAHGALDWTLQALRDHIGVGADLVMVGLQSPVTRNRNMALNVLKAWPPEAWPAPAREIVELLSLTDPNERTREFAGQVLRGEEN